MAKGRRETVRLYFPDPGELQISIFEIQGANKLDGKQIVRLSFNGIHLAFDAKLAKAIAKTMLRSARQISEHEQAGGAAEGSDED